MTKELKKQTPYKTKDWYLKWASSIILIVGMLLTSNNIYPLNLFISIVGLLGWILVGLIWNDRAIIIINAIGLSIYANGILNHYVNQ
jgi:hypothetical protein|tara:strand:- start:314 stop:574 length:261 start_codon:yes stop_codon:yes gene_type:complete